MSLTPTEIVRNVYAAFARRDAAEVFGWFSPHVEIVQSAELPWGGHFHGHEGARQFFTLLTTHLNSTIEIERLVRAGDSIVAIGWTTGNVNATGAPYRVPIAHLWEIRDGKVVRIHFCIDNPSMLAALAAPPGPGP
jgi:ketosteroid isomerase-like protein